jgi:hypothetical protein
MCLKVVEMSIYILTRIQLISCTKQSIMALLNISIPLYTHIVRHIMILSLWFIDLQPSAILVKYFKSIEKNVNNNRAYRNSNPVIESLEDALPFPYLLGIITTGPFSLRGHLWSVDPRLKAALYINYIYSSEHITPLPHGCKVYWLEAIPIHDTHSSVYRTVVYSRNEACTCIERCARTRYKLSRHFRQFTVPSRLIVTYKTKETYLFFSTSTKDVQKHQITERTVNLSTNHVS